MSRLTISLPDNLYNRIAALAMQREDSMSAMVNQLIQVGLQHWYANPQDNPATTHAEQHCQQLIIQMNALMKSMSVELLKFKADDFDKLQQAAATKLNELRLSG
jgi:hypothetical protein